MTAVEDVRPAIARFRGANGRVTGAGCLLPGGRILTCAHVVNAALGRPGDAAERPAGPLSVEFPHAGGGATTATVLLDGGWNGAADVAVLALDTAPPAAPLRLLEPRGVAADLWDHSVRAWGFPDGSTEHGLASTGELRDRLANGTFQINRADGHSPFIARGFSGGPIWDEVLSGVVGIIVQAQEQLNVAACLPVAALLAACPALADCIDVFDPLAEYRAAVVAETARVDLRGVPLPTSVDGRRISINLPLDRVYVRLRTVREEGQRRAEEEQRRAIESEAQAKATREETGEDYLRLIDRLGEYLYARQAAERQADEPIDPEAALRERKRLVVLGPPGAGKSTLLRYLARRAVDDSRRPTPVLVRLGQYAARLGHGAAVSLIDFVLEGLPRMQRETVQAAAERGDVLWLLDALDEARETAPQVLEQLRELKGQLVLTSRPLGYEPGLAAELAHYELLPLDAGEIEQFLGNWFGVLAEAQGLGSEWAAEWVQATQARVAERPGLRPLLGNPLLLTFTAVLGGKDPADELPHHRAELYRRYLAELLDSWEGERRRRGAAGELTVGPLRGKAARDALRDGVVWLGWWLHLAYYGGRPARTPLEDEITKGLAAYYLAADDYADLKRHEARAVAGDVVRFWREAGLLDVWQLRTDAGPVDFLAFRHVTFQEYGAAVVLTESWRKERERAWAFLRPRLHLRAWREPLLLMGAILSPAEADALLMAVLNAGSLYEEVLRRDLIEAIAVAGEGKGYSGPGHTALTEKLIYVIRHASLESPPDAVIDAMHSLTPFFRPSSLVNKHAYMTTARLSTGWAAAIKSELLAILAEEGEEHGSCAAAAAALGQIGDVTTVPALVAALEHEHEGVRRTAAQALGRICDTSAVPGLLLALQDRDEWVRATSAEALGKIGDTTSVPGLTAALRDDYEAVRWTATRVLGEFGDVAALSGLVAMLRDKDAMVRLTSAEALGRIGDVAVLSDLQGALRDEDALVRRKAAEAIGIIGDVAALSELLLALSDQNSNVRAAAFAALGKLDKTVVVPKLMAELRSGDIPISWAAAEALGWIGDAAVLPDLLAALRDKNSSVREAATVAIGWSDNASVLPEILTVLRDEISSVRESAAEALGWLGDIAVVPELLAMLRDEVTGVRQAAAEALGRIGDATVVPELLSMLQDKDSGVREVAARALGEIGDKVAVPHLLEAMGDRSERVRRSAAEALGRLGSPAAGPRLVMALWDGDWTVSLTSAVALAQIGDVAAMPGLLVGLEDPNWMIRRNAAEALGELGDAAAVPGLLKALCAESSVVRQVAAKALGRIGDTAAIPGLLITLQDKDNEVCEAAAEALGEIGDVSAVPGLCKVMQGWHYGISQASCEALKRIATRSARAPLTAATSEFLRHVRWLFDDGFEVLYHFATRLSALDAAVLPADELLLPSMRTEA